MSEEVNKEKTKDAEQEKITELSDEQLAEAQGAAATRTHIATLTDEENDENNQGAGVGGGWDADEMKDGGF